MAIACGVRGVSTRPVRCAHVHSLQSISVHKGSIRWRARRLFTVKQPPRTPARQRLIHASTTPPVTHVDMDMVTHLRDGVVRSGDGVYDGDGVIAQRATRRALAG
eukprot:7383554-Prymnesium_polylepis.1